MCARWSGPFHAAWPELCRCLHAACLGGAWCTCWHMCANHQDTAFVDVGCAAINCYSVCPSAPAGAHIFPLRLIQITIFFQIARVYPTICCLGSGNLIAVGHHRLFCTLYRTPHQRLDGCLLILFPWLVPHPFSYSTMVVECCKRKVQQVVAVSCSRAGGITVSCCCCLFPSHLVSDSAIATYLG